MFRHGPNARADTDADADDYADETNESNETIFSG